MLYGVAYTIKISKRARGKSRAISTSSCRRSRASADMTWLGLTPPTRPCAYFLIGFETEKELMIDWVDRTTYMERLWALEGTWDIKVITGMRRSSKSELMKAFSTSVARKDPSSNNVYIDLLDLDNELLLEYQRCIAKS